MKKIIISTITLLLMFSLSACAVLENSPLTSTSEDSVSPQIGRDGSSTKDRRGETSEKSSITDVYSMVKDFVPQDFASNVMSGNFNFNDITNNIKVEGRNETKVIDGTNVNSLMLNPDIGNIEITLSNDTNIYLEISYGMIGKKDETFSEEDLNNISWQAENVNGTVNIGHSYTGSNTTSIVAANYKIQIPANITLIDIDANVANISIKDILAQLNISVGTGNIETHNIGLKNDSFIDINTGAIQLNVAKFEEIKSISSKCSTGEIRVNISEINLGTLEYINIENSIGSINFKMATPFNNIKLKNTLGDITSNVDYK